MATTAESLLRIAYGRLRNEGFWVLRGEGRLRVDLGDGIPVVAEAIDAGIILSATVLAEDAASPRAVLEAGARIGGGGLALERGHYLMRYVIPAAQAESAPLASAVRFVSRGAEEVRAKLAGVQRTAAVELFFLY